MAAWYVGEAPSEADSDLAQFMEDAGLPPPPPVEKVALLLPELQTTVKSFTAVTTQFLRDKDNIEIALNYQAADVAWKYLGLTLTPSDFDNIQRIERYVLSLIRGNNEHPEFTAEITLRW